MREALEVWEDGISIGGRKINDTVIIASSQDKKQSQKNLKQQAKNMA